ncbi:protein of unknown function [Pseudobutyrivibrio sp. YE44]|uniref:DUF4869 domain-containing protein n=1 Tax=Pseudobutyrivibrio sp. YE44 TaxID=1520802 RepID=UPI00088C4BCF|nr:DUF4869 domain-containing protein [Pseudobutyrivibrio sp. YE44]SDB28724.1 protein of unknown function [Pseudobutyrivibrio sp. YE44]
MLNIYFGEREKVMHGPTWFRFNYRSEWLADSLVQEMMESIDKSSYKGGELIESEVLGPIPPERLSGGLQTLISIYERPDLMFNATSCGENCAKWLIEIGKRKDVTVNLRYLMPFDDAETFEINILNDNCIVHNMSEYLELAIKYV